THLGCQRIIVEPLNFSGSVQFRCGLDFNTHYEIGAGWDQTGEGGFQQSGQIINFWNCECKGVVDNGWAIQAQTARSGHQLFSSFRLNSEQELNTTLVEDDKFIGVDFTLKVKQGITSSVEKIVVNDWFKTPNIDTLWTRGLELTKQYAAVSFDSALVEHTTFWNTVWDIFDIEIEGDPDVLQGLRFSDFQTYQSYHGENADLNALCKGLTGEVYFGWVFWDSEIYSHRLMMFVDPSVAKNLLLYRYHRLPQAMERAKQLDCEGARFPFASITGTEDSGTWQHVDLEIHADMAIAYAIWHQDKICPDKPFLYHEGIEMLLQICRFMASAGGWSPLNGDFGFYGVMGPDEFHMMVNHNYYTNVMGKKTFEFTLSVLDEMQRKAPDEYRQAIAKTNFKPEEFEKWKKMAEKMRILKDERTGVFEQHAGYFDLPHVNLKSLTMEQIPIYKNWAYVKIFRHNMIKQPDVLNLMYFFSQDYTLEEKRANYEFYEARTIHESSLSPSLHAILAAELGKMDEAYKFFAYGARLDLDDYNRNTEQGLHVTSAAGVWASMIFGFGGMRTDGDALIFNPTLPTQWNSYRFRVYYQGAKIEVLVDREKVQFQVISGPSVTINVYETNYVLSSEKTKVKLR
ncbi:MAG: family 65 glycosyl hydrolase, partial [Anaerolinea sp.]|nr:family 65 glycosyl hydrolase [Anaerolinea sp.]